MAVLDAAFLIDLQRQPRKTVPILDALIDNAEPLLVPMVVAVEIAQGSLEPALAFAAIEERFELRPFDREVALVAARLGSTARQQRRHPGAADVQIAATAVVERTYVVSSNARDFRDRLGVPVWDYLRQQFPPD